MKRPLGKVETRRLSEIMGAYQSEFYTKLGDPIRMNDRLFDFLKMKLTQESECWSNAASREGFNKSYMWL